MTKVFTDMHHAGLYQSLQILFEKRLGWELFRPIGTEWATEGYWMNAKIYGNHPDTIKQYLEIKHSIPTKLGPRNEVIDENENYYTIQNPFLNEKAITVAQFRKMKPNVVIASYYDNIEPFKRLAKEVGAKFIVQMGNEWPVSWDSVDNVLASTGKFSVPPNKNVVFYHQEFDLSVFYKGVPDFNSNKIASFVHCLAEHDIFEKDWQDFQELEKLLPEYEFKSYGISNRDGIIGDGVADKMRECKFGIHLKNKGDGFGHGIHSWFAIGRPIIFRGSQYKGKLAASLLIHEITGFDLDKVSLQEVAERIRKLTKDEYIAMCDNAFKTFKQVVNFDKEFINIKKFFENLL